MEIVERLSHGGKQKSLTAQTIKVWWMAFWRFSFFTSTTLFGSDADTFLSAWFVATSVSLVLVPILGVTVRIFPLFNLLRGKSPLLEIRHRALRPQRVKRPTGGKTYDVPTTNRASYPSVAHSQRGNEKLTTSSRPGRKTGYEPSALKSVSIQKSPWIIGDPGFGLNSSNFDSTSIKLGQDGEQNFARALKKCGLIDRYQSFWSCAMPSNRGLYRDPSFDTDIDCILFNGETVFLIDLKNYKGGALTYTDRGGRLVCIDDETQKEVSINEKRSRNMQMALERFNAHLRGSGIKVAARVVFMPSDRGAGRIQGVYWPDNIPALYLDDFLSELNRHAGYRTTPQHERVGSALRGLVKRW